MCLLSSQKPPVIPPHAALISAMQVSSIEKEWESPPVCFIFTTTQFTFPWRPKFQSGVFFWAERPPPISVLWRSDGVEFSTLEKLKMKVVSFGCGILSVFFFSLDSVLTWLQLLLGLHCLWLEVSSPSGVFFFCSICVIFLFLPFQQASLAFLSLNWYVPF